MTWWLFYAPGDEKIGDGEVTWWTCNREARVGDDGLLYLRRPTSSITAQFKVASDAKRSRRARRRQPRHPFECAIRAVRQMKCPITLDELRGHPRLPLEWPLLRGNMQPPGGVPPEIPDRAVAHLLRLRPEVRTWGRHSPTAPLAAEREREALMRLRRDARLRDRVFRDYGIKCAACGIVIEHDGVVETEVAHLIEVGRRGSDEPRNALPLCRAHHWAFDRLAIGIDPRRRMFVVARPLRDRVRFLGVNGRPLGEELSKGLSKRALRDRWQRWRKQGSRP